MQNNTHQETIVNQSELPRKPDTYTWFYTFLTGAFFLLVVILDALDQLFNFYLLMVPIIGLPALIWVAMMFIGLCINIYRRRWRRVASIVAAPFIAGLFFIIISRCGVTNDRIRLEYNKSSYLKEVAEIQVADGSPRLKTWNWGGTGGAVGTSIFYILVYDDSDLLGAAVQFYRVEPKPGRE